MTKVKLRRKAISQGRLTLYLDYYPPIPNPDTGKLTRREFLGLYIFEDPKTKLDKNYNKDTISLAENVRTAQQMEVNQRQIYHQTEYPIISSRGASAGVPTATSGKAPCITCSSSSTKAPRFRSLL